jgi:hypothetical protein
MLKRWVPLAIGALATGAVVGAAYFTLTGSTKASDVDVKVDNETVRRASLEDAVDEVSRLVGFQVRKPSGTPRGFEVADVEASLGPPDLARPLKRSILRLVRPAEDGRPDRGVIVIEQTPVPFAPPDRFDEKVDLGVPGIDTYYQRLELVEGYWVFAPDAGFLVTIRGADRPDRGEVLAMLRSLVE